MHGTFVPSDHHLCAIDSCALHGVKSQPVPARQMSAASTETSALPGCLRENDKPYFCYRVLSESETEKENDQIHAQYIQNDDIVRACGVP